MSRRITKLASGDLLLRDEDGDLLRCARPDTNTGGGVYLNINGAANAVALDHQQRKALRKQLKRTRP